jgi:hypothetical protein
MSEKPVQEQIDELQQDPNTLIRHSKAAKDNIGYWAKGGNPCWDVAEIEVCICGQIRDTNQLTSFRHQRDIRNMHPKTKRKPFKTDKAGCFPVPPHRGGHWIARL